MQFEPANPSKPKLKSKPRRRTAPAPDQLAKTAPPAPTPPEVLQTLQEPENALPTGSPSVDDGPVPDLGPEPGVEGPTEGEDGGEVSPTGTELTVRHPLTQAELAAFEIWKVTFASAFRVSGSLSRLETLAGAPELPTYEPAAKAIYDAIWDAPAFHWLLKPELKWGARSMDILAFAGAVSVGCIMEIRAKKQAAQEAKRNPQGRPAAAGGAVEVETVKADPPPAPHTDMEPIRGGGG